MGHHEKYMQRCLQLAINGMGTTYPNPLVGCVIVHNDRIIGEGWHYQSGMPHAEVLAIRSVKDQSLLKESTIYVSLEPCSHFGKTPPCANLIIEHQIPYVVIGCIDSFSEVSGNGIRKLKSAGIHVELGILEQESLMLNKRFFTFHNKKRPFVILKWAETQDQFIAPLHKKTKEPFWLTNSYSRQLVHQWRTEEQAILVGTKTIIEDDPQLNARDYRGKSPVRIIIDRNLKIDDSYQVRNATQTTIIINEIVDKDEHNLMFRKINFTDNIASELLNVLFHENIQSVIIEGGKQMLDQFIEANLWDEARVFKTIQNLNDGIKAPILSQNFVLDQQTFILSDQLNYYKNASVD